MTTWHRGSEHAHIDIDLQTSLADLDFTISKMKEATTNYAWANLQEDQPDGPYAIYNPCADPAELWVLEQYIPEDSCFDGAARSIGKDSWRRILHPRKFEVAIRWIAKKVQSGLTVRMRSIDTGEIIPGEIFV